MGKIHGKIEKQKKNQNRNKANLMELGEKNTYMMLSDGHLPQSVHFDRLG